MEGTQILVEYPGTSETSPLWARAAAWAVTPIAMQVLEAPKKETAHTFTDVCKIVSLTFCSSWIPFYFWISNLLPGPQQHPGEWK